MLLEMWRSWSSQCGKSSSTILLPVSIHLYGEKKKVVLYHICPSTTWEEPSESGSPHFYSPSMCTIVRRVFQVTSRPEFSLNDSKHCLSVVSLRSDNVLVTYPQWFSVYQRRLDCRTSSCGSVKTSEGASGLMWYCSSDTLGYKQRPVVYQTLTLYKVYHTPHPRLVIPFALRNGTVM